MLTLTLLAKALCSHSASVCVCHYNLPASRHSARPSHQISLPGSGLLRHFASVLPLPVWP
eukprot:6251002-Amphidinium_carterae.2